MVATQDKEFSFFIQFTGQGVKYWDELCRLYKNHPVIRPFIHEGIAEVRRQASLHDDTRTRFFTQGLDFEHWIEHPEDAPDLSYLMSQPISHPMLFLCEISNYISLIQEGMNQDLLLKHTHSATGFSTGVVPSIIVSMGLPLDELCRVALKTLAMFFWGGIRTQQSILQFGVQSKLVPELLDSPEGSPSCMVGITGLEISQLEEQVYAFSNYGVVYPCYELLPDRWIVSGLPEDLEEFKKFLKEQNTEMTWRYTPMTIGAHCQILTFAGNEAMPEDVERLGIAFRGEEMKFPVWSTKDGTDLRNNDNIMLDVIDDYYCQPARWRDQIAPVLEPNRITHVLAFGPGSGLASITERHIPDSDVKVVPCALPIGRKVLVEEILPALDGA